MADRRQLAEQIPTGLDIILDRVVCVGNESELSDCASNEFGNALGCMCSDNYQRSFCVIWCNKMTRLYQNSLKLCKSALIYAVRIT